ncbi:protein peste-like [Haematobia irritans]|uniref:protein peste-like n=1 Tax=Haematobia irritans TaxID=7368 RepID=UPI003F4F5464
MPQKSRDMRIWSSSSRQALLVGTLGFILGICGILCGMFWEQIFNGILNKQMVLRPDSMVYDKWKNPPVALNLDIYLYNWTNSEDFANTSTKPILEQCGPYRFIEKPDKVDIDWNNKNSSVTYRRKSYFYFDAAGSNGSLDDEIITLNAVALSAGAKTKYWDAMNTRLVNMGLTVYNQQMTVTKTVDELLFTGYSDDMITTARTMTSMFGKKVEVPFDKFGWFYTRNGSADLTGVFNVFTGADDISRLGQMHNWNYKSHSGFFESHCGMINGSGGEFYPPNLTPDSIVGLFSPDMCRTIPLDYAETVEIEGIKGYKYTGGPRSVDNGTLYPENACFCGGECVPSGVMNVSSCRFGTPVFMSFPHFYQADPYYVNQVEGLNPNKDQHEFYMILEPRTGVALEVAARFQVNMLVEPLKGVSLYEDVPRTFLPLIWFEQRVRITPELASDLKMIPRVLLGGQIFAAILLAIGIVMLVWFPVQHLCLSRRHRNSITLHNSENGKFGQQATSCELKPLHTPPKSPAIPKQISEECKPDHSPLLEKSIKAVVITDKLNSGGSSSLNDKNIQN